MSTAHDAVAAERFDPKRYEAFRFVGHELDPNGPRARLRYALDDEIVFEEEILFEGATLPTGAAEREALDRALWLLHLTAGVSYYKTAAPQVLAIETGPLPPAAESYLRDLYRLGLAEFAWTNDLPLDRELTIRAERGDLDPVAGLALPRRTAIPVGGGKDSIVTIEALRAIGEPVVLFSVGDFPEILATVRTAGLEHILVRRRLSPNLFELNRAGAYNGHVPVTAVVSSIACVAAILYGFDTIAMSNERSASFGNFASGGVDVNHQYSKGADFERALRGVLAAHVTGPALDYVSLLRPASELAIGRAFARLTRYHHSFTSCNSVFRIDAGRRGTSWCANCPKCRFVFLILAPYMTPAALVDIFGANVLDEQQQLAGFEALLGAGNPKPFECVGQVEESAAAFRLLGAQDAWRASAVVARVCAEHLPGIDRDLSDPRVFLTLDDAPLLQPRFAAAVRGMLGGG